ncbi:hypothetical protein H5410_057132 [Solanum commersonii]|uniref:Response regulatory domain-containing protein n=1 Tax=Solanum commersonii TaxID=4109 RepID=A0A9J5WQ10_SOLCO|nr:hypothetical protein H5410_057132 [Solanum commersonii]
MKVGLDECYEKPLTKVILQSFVEKISNKFGVETLGVRNGFMAFNIHDETQMRFDLIVMSSTMPIMDGNKKASINGDCYDDYGIINPDDNEEYHKEFMEAGLDECYEKPLTKEILQSLVEKNSNHVWKKIKG